MTRGRGLLAPVILISVGLVFLLANLGLLTDAAVNRFADLWPLVLVVVGLDLVFRATLPPRLGPALGVGTLALALVGSLAYAVAGPATGAGTQTEDLSAAVQQLSSARLDLSAGSAEISLHSADLGEDLYRAHLTYPAGERPTVELSRSDGTLQVRFPSSNFGFRFNQRRAIDITLSSRLPWQVAVSGGATRSTAELGGLELTSLDLSGGANNLVVTLPSPKGTVPVNISGGASDVTIHRPRGTAAHAEVSGGANSLHADGTTFNSLGGIESWSSAGYDSASDRYAIQVSGGATSVTIDTQ